MRTVKLYRLPNGRWIDPRQVMSIEPLEAKEPDGFLDTFIPPRVIVCHGNGRVELLQCISMEVAQREADRIAEEVNDLREAP